MNNDKSVKFTYVHNIIKDFRAVNQTYRFYTIDNGKQIKVPNILATPSGKLINLMAVLKDKNAPVGNYYYLDEDETAVMTRFDGSIACDYSDIVYGELANDALSGEYDILYADPLVQEMLNDCAQEY